MGPAAEGQEAEKGRLGKSDTYGFYLLALDAERKIISIKMYGTADITGINRKNLFIMKNMPSCRLSACICRALRKFNLYGLLFARL